MKYAVAVLLLGVTLRSAQASCPNACSGNGVCTDYDSCVCYRNFMGGDCSLRVCPFDYAWVTTPNGDLNFDGDLLDGTFFAHDQLLSTDGNSLTTQAAPGGTWEQWPGTASTASDEGHFYMECSNKGLCDRTTGQCQCFDGYTGVGCKRTTCPENCNGHGACKTINQLKDGTTYQLWDGDKDRSCVCDAGYSGPTCLDRDCPKGDDPLTKTHQIAETQYIDIRATCTPDQTSTSNCRDRATNSGTGLDGTATLTFTDAFGETWTTDRFDVEAMTGATDTATISAAVKAALEALPNDVIGTVTVTTGFCEVPSAGVYDTYVAGTGAGGAADNYMRCPAADDGGTSYGDVVAAGDGVVYHADTSTSAAGVAASTDSTNDACFEIQYPECIRFGITFDDQPGDITDLSVDVTSVTMNGATNAMDTTVLIAAAVSETISLNQPITAANANDGTVTYTAPVAFSSTCSSWAGDNLSFVLASLTHGAYPANAAFSLACNSKELGIFTLSAAVTANAPGTPTFAFNEAITSSQNECDTNTGLTMVLTPISNYLATDMDLSLYGDLVGKAVSLNGVSAGGVVESVAWATPIGTIFLNADATFAGSDVSTGALLIKGTGTKENNECSDRGVCDRVEGLCKCFKGYNGDACETQNALAA